MASKNKEEVGMEDGNSFGPPKAPLLNRLESTEYFEGCSDPEKIFGANLSKIMASFALQSNDDINLADLATPKAQSTFPVQPIDSRLDIGLIDTPRTSTGGDFARRRHSSVHFTQPLDGFMENGIDPPGFERSRFNSRSYGGEMGYFVEPDLVDTQEEDFTVPQYMVRNVSRYSVSQSKRRVTLDGVEQSPRLNNVQNVMENTVIGSTIEESLREFTEEDYEFSHQNIHFTSSEVDYGRRGSRRHSSPPKRFHDVAPDDVYMTGDVPGLNSQIEPRQMDVNATPFEPSISNKWYGKPQSTGSKVLSEQSRQNNASGHSHTKNPVTSSSNNMNNPLQRYKNSAKRPTIDDLSGHVVEFARDSQGSRYLQQIMDVSTAINRKLIIDEIIDEMVSLSCHPFGNYVVQNFLQYATDQQLVLLGENFIGSALKVSNDNHGCRAIQFALDVLPIQVRNKVIDEICDNVVAISKNSHGTHVVQKCLGYMASEAIYGSSEEVQANQLCRSHGVPTTADLLRKVELKVLNGFLRLAIHPYSYRLIQFTLADCNETRSDTLKNIMKRVRQNYHPLALDQHGNFILQHILDKGSPKQKNDVQNFVCRKVLMLSQHKFGSHLVEKCLSTASQSEVANVVKQIMKPSGDNLRYFSTVATTECKNALLLLSKDPYANFVVQKAYKYAPVTLKRALGTEILKYADVLSRYTYGRHILSKVTN